MKRLITLLLLLPLLAHAQSASEIMSNPDYLWADGRAGSTHKADQAALSNLTSQISVTIIDDTRLLLTNDTSILKSAIKTFSAATLNNTRRIIIRDEPDAHVLRYIRKADLDLIWKARASKVRDFSRIANLACEQRRIGDALRYYYWAHTLLQSIPVDQGITVEDESGIQQPAATWLPMRLNTLLDGISAKMVKSHGDLFDIAFFLDGKPVANLDFTYYDGQDWSPTTSAHDGIGQAEVRPGFDAPTLKLRIEYQYFADALSDKEVHLVLEASLERSFPRCAKEVRLSGRAGAEQKELERLGKSVAASGIYQSAMSAEQAAACQQVMSEVVKAIRSKDYRDIARHCTPDGQKAFNQLIHYGNARIVGNPELHFSQFGDAIYCRSLTLNFSFSKNRQFIEDAVFVFNKEGKIDGIQFGLGKVAIADINGQPEANMSEVAKIVLVNFLENYKTAYALGRIDYLERVFSDDALIIVGKVVERVTGSAESGYRTNRQVRLTQHSKEEYLKGLRRVFASNEFVNLKLANNRILKSGKGGELYAIQIRQDYFSANYGDSGYLFLLVDLNNPDQPIIHVRAWQELPDEDWGLIDLSIF